MPQTLLKQNAFPLLLILQCVLQIHVAFKFTSKENKMFCLRSDLDPRPPDKNTCASLTDPSGQMGATHGQLLW